MKNSMLAAILFPITIILTSYCFEKIGIIDNEIDKKETITNNIRNKNPPLFINSINSSGTINNEFTQIPPTSPATK